MSRLCKILNRLICRMYRKEYHKFMKSCDLRKVQTDYLKKLLKSNSSTVYGKEFDFSDLKSYQEFAEKVPLTTYEDYETYIKRAADGEKAVLTKERIQLFELTSGSSSSKKLIPYTKSLKREFQRGIKPWLFDIYRNIHGTENGQSYWSITPVTAGKVYTKCGIPIGFEEDAEYFGSVEQYIMHKLFAVDGSVKFSDDMDRFYERTSVQLLNCQELTLISVWNPTFLTILCDYIGQNVDRLSKQLPEKRRIMIQEAIKAKDFEQIFPDLKIISCWADGSAANYIGKVKEYFPHVLIQPKGLLATECFVSFPLVNEEGARLSIYSHFFEFRSLLDGTIVLADQLTLGEYEVIITTGGGLYRYCIGDIIEVLETYPDHPPRIKFKRRAGICSDLFGEKLTEEFIQKVCSRLKIINDFCLLAPEGTQYCLFTTANDITDDMLDQELCESYHYHYCRQLGQLKKSHVIQVEGNPAKTVIDRLSKEGIRIGDIKPSYLSRRQGWRSYFKIVKERENNND